MTHSTDGLEAELACIAEREAVVRAWVARVEPDALRQAVAGASEGPLQGMTLGVKDIIDTAELTTERGSPIYRGRRAGADAACVALARRAGAVLSGKTATTEFAVLTPTVTTNPHDATRTPGGSSSGSAAAVAAGMVRLAFGTQTAGSVIRPASFCGVVGFKPTYHSVPVSGVCPFASSLDTVGYFARTVGDIEALHLALTARGSAPTDRPRTLRVGLYRSHQWSAADPDSVAAVERAAAALRSAGVVLEEPAPFAACAELADHAQTIMLGEGCRSLAWERATADEELSPGLRKLLAQGDAVTTERYRSAQRAAVIGRNAFDAAMEGYDALLTPAVIGEAPALATTGDPVFCRVWTLLGAPALSIPAGTGSARLPIGVQLIGARWDDSRLLAVGATLASALA